MTGGFSSFNWQSRLDMMFPVLDVEDPHSIELVRENWWNPNSKFSWFCHALKMAHVRLKRKPLFIRWLMLSFARPWTKGSSFLLSWKWTAADFEKAVSIVANAEVFDTVKISEKLFYRLKDDTELSHMLRLSIAGIYAWGYENFISYWKHREDKGRLRDLVSSRKTVTKRELQIKLRIKVGRLEMLLDELKKEKLIREKHLPRNSVEITWLGAVIGA